jgi:serine/threonine protein kinase
MIDPDLTLKLTDFGFATFKKNLGNLKSYKGTFTYMAPEIKEMREYNGKSTDLFSAAVVLFVIVVGKFPFPEARLENAYYQLICEKRYDEYWEKINCFGLSPEFKDLMERMLSYDPSERPSLDEIRNHSWMKLSFNHDKTKSQILQELDQARMVKTTASSHDSFEVRGDDMMDFVKEVSYLPK